MNTSKIKGEASERPTSDPEPLHSGPDTGTLEGGGPGLLLKTPLGPALIVRPTRSKYVVDNCESAEKLIGRGVQEMDAFERMGVTREQLYYWRADTLRGQNADLEKLLRRYRRRAEKDAKKIAKLERALASAAVIENDHEEVEDDTVSSAGST